MTQIFFEFLYYDCRRLRLHAYCIWMWCIFKTLMEAKTFGSKAKSSVKSRALKSINLKILLLENWTHRNLVDNQNQRQVCPKVGLWVIKPIRCRNVFGPQVSPFLLLTSVNISSFLPELDWLHPPHLTSCHRYKLVDC